MPTTSRAGLVLHEVVYSEALKQGQRDSVATRKMVGLLASKEIESFTQSQYDDFIARQFPAPKAVSFNTNGIELFARSGEPLTIELSQFLCTPGKLNWSTLEKLPKWMELRSSQSILNVTPPASKESTERFNLTVDDGIDGSIVPLTIRSYLGPELPPLFMVSPVIVRGHSQENFEWSLSRIVAGDGARFDILTGPKWLKINDSGDLRGVPPKEGEDQWTILASSSVSHSSVQLVMKISGMRTTPQTRRRTQ
ncbi:MAG: hypothetical protein HYZ71_17210 [Deltaproteobacteria bacterium]|nr:hypothetical protein [Deltaproteobacteria bacterium]